MSELREYEIFENGVRRTYLLSDEDAANTAGVVEVTDAKAHDAKNKQTTARNKTR